MPIRKIILYSLLGAILGFLGQFVFDFFTWNYQGGHGTFFNWFSSDASAIWLINSISTHHWVKATMLVYQAIFIAWLGGRTDVAIRTALVAAFLLATCVMGANEWSKKAKPAGRRFAAGYSLSWRLTLMVALAGILLGLGGQFLYDYFFWEGRGKGWTMHFALNDKVIEKSFPRVPPEDFAAAKVVGYQTTLFFWLGKRADVLGRTVLITTASALCLSLLANRFRRRRRDDDEVPGTGAIGRTQPEAVASSTNATLTSSGEEYSPPQLALTGTEDGSTIINVRQTDEDALHAVAPKEQSAEQ